MNTYIEETLKGGHRTATMWQEVPDGVAEPALVLRTYENGELPLIEIKQGESSILINGETVPSLFKLLKSWLASKTAN